MKSGTTASALHPITFRNNSFSSPALDRLHQRQRNQILKSPTSSAAASNRKISAPTSQFARIQSSNKTSLAFCRNQALPPFPQPFICINQPPSPHTPPKAHQPAPHDREALPRKKQEISPPTRTLSGVPHLLLQRSFAKTLLTCSRRNVEVVLR